MDNQFRPEPSFNEIPGNIPMHHDDVSWLVGQYAAPERMERNDGKIVHFFSRHPLLCALVAVFMGILTWVFVILPLL